MSQKITIYILEDDKTACDDLAYYIKRHEDLQLVGTSGNADEALEAVCVFVPDLIILDLELHHGGGNGLIFLDRLNQQNFPNRPYILVTTQNTSQFTLEQARRAGADFTITKYEKGYCAEYVIRFIESIKDSLSSRYADIKPQPHITPEQREQMARQSIQHEFDLIGMSPKLLGYTYLTDAIYTTMTEPCHNLAQKLAVKYQKSSTSIERAMQHAINTTWHTSNLDDLLTNYTAHIRADKGVPTLMEFVSYYARKLKKTLV